MKSGDSRVNKARSDGKEKGHGVFVSGGWTGNDRGRPKGTKNKFSIAELRQAIKNVEKRLHVSFMETWIEAAWADPQAMGNIANYMLPKLRAVEQLNVAADSMSDEEAEQIRKDMLERFGGSDYKPNKKDG